MPTSASQVTFRPLTTGDLPMIAEWLSRPHVAAWWDGPATLAEVETKYAPVISGMVPVRAFLAVADGEEIGFIQSYMPAELHDRGWWLDEHDPGVRGIDQYLARSEQLGQGLGTAMVKIDTPDGRALLMYCDR